MNPDRYKSLPLAPPPRTQALTSTTFTQPPLDGSLSVPELYDWHLAKSPEHPLFAYSDEHGTVNIINWPEGVRAVHRAGQIIQSYATQDMKGLSDRPIYAILAAADTITYYTVMAGIVRAGYIAFPISPRNSPPAIAHLLSKTGVARVLVGPEAAMENLAAASLKLLGESRPDLPVLSTIPSFEQLFRPGVSDDFRPIPAYKPQWDDAAIILHSSGSTAFPKPVIWNHYRYLLLGLTPCFGERDMTGRRLSCHGMPMFHGMGMMQTAWTAVCGLVLTAFKPQSPAIAPTPDSLLRGAIDTQSDYIFCVPSFVETWAKNPEDVRMLQKTQGILYGGGPLSQTVGDALTKQGISIFILYGSTECGVMNPILPKTVGDDWQYFTFPSNIKPHFVPDAHGNSELIMIPNHFQVPCVLNTTVDGVEAYATNDLLAPHPTKPGYWRIFGRADDQIMHNTGEKTNPGPLENILNQDVHVQSAVMFGRGRFNAGVLIDPRPAYKFDPVDETKLVAFRNAIWPTVEKLNAFAPQHSRLFKEMIVVSSPSKPFTYTAKNTARRQAILNDYEPEIEALYAAVDETTQADLPPPITWDRDSSIKFVRDVVGRVLETSVGDMEDIFQQGCDSLQATWIRNSVLHALRESAKVDTRSVPTTFVYRYPSVIALGSYVSKLANGVADNDRDRTQEMQLMVEKYTSTFPTHVPHMSKSQAVQDTVILTGSTGGLGSSLLVSLVKCPEVARVYALNRTNKLPLGERQRQALDKRSLNASVVDSPKLVLLEVDFSRPDLGLESRVIDEIRSSTTHIIHNAWPVNFNMSLESFEPSVHHLRGLIDIALSSPLSSPPRFIFISSVGILRNVDASKWIIEGPVDASVAVGTGYSESKWVCEQVLSAAADTTALSPITIRVGQLCGTTSGAWNEAEWFPALVRSSVELGSLPMLDKEISWLPIDEAVTAITEMRSSTSLYLHLAHPHPTSWSTIINPVSEKLGLPLVPYEQWLTGLQASASDESIPEIDRLRRNPSLKILDFFQSADHDSVSKEAMGIPRIDLTQTLQSAPSLGRLAPLSAENASKWVAYWQQSGLL